MAFGENDQSNDTPIGVPEYRAFVESKEPSDGDTLTWSAAEKRWKPTVPADANLGVFSVTDINSLSFANQDPPNVGPGSAIPVDFGGFTEITVGQVGQYSVSVQFTFGRQNNNQVARLWLYSTKNGLVAGLTDQVSINRSAEVIKRTATFVQELVPSDVFEIFIYRDSFAPNDGGLITIPNADGFPDVPSARIEVTQFKILPT